MSLTLGHGPLSRAPAMQNFAIDGPAHRLHFEPFEHRVRAELGGRTVLDTTRGALLHETGILPVLYAPVEDYDGSLLTPTEHTTHCPFKGDAGYWNVGAAENALWGYPSPLQPALWLAGHAALYFDRMDRWLDEDEEVLGGWRDPYHRADAVASSRPVEVRLDGELIARDDAPVLVFETGLAPRGYIARDGLALEPSPTTSTCPYKGHASYWHLRVGERLLEDAAWSYEQPRGDVAAIAGRVSLDHEALTVSIA
jgi:uncharacterized protein (DUF427 family)